MVDRANSAKYPVAIGALSRESGCHIETIRYYERIGLMPQPTRTESGRRSYGPGELRRLRFIRRSRELGFSVEEIRRLLSLVGGGNMTCANVLETANAHLADIRRKIEDLEKMALSLEALTAQCEGDDVPRCPIIDDLVAD